MSVVGIARSPDPARFVLTDGQSMTFEAEAVESEKVLAGTIGQSIVQLEIDAKRAPDSPLASIGFKARADALMVSSIGVSAPLAEN